MKIIQEISEMIDDELQGAEEYAKFALKLREDNPGLANAFYDIANQEMNHVNILHEQVVRIIKMHREKHGEPPAAMMAVYDYLHKRHIENLAEARRYQEIYKSR